MTAKVIGNVKLDECTDRANKSTGEIIPYTALVSGKEVVMVSGLPYKDFKPFEAVEILCDISQGTYGMYVKVRH